MRTYISKPFCFTLLKITAEEKKKFAADYFPINNIDFWNFVNTSYTPLLTFHLQMYSSFANTKALKKFGRLFFANIKRSEGK